METDQHWDQQEKATVSMKGDVTKRWQHRSQKAQKPDRLQNGTDQSNNNGKPFPPPGGGEKAYRSLMQDGTRQPA